MPNLFGIAEREEDWEDWEDWENRVRVVSFSE